MSNNNDTNDEDFWSVSSVKEENSMEAGISRYDIMSTDDNDGNDDDQPYDDPMETPIKVSKRIKPRGGVNRKQQHSSDSIEGSNDVVSVDGGASKASSIIDDILEYFDLEDKCTPKECMCFTCLFISVVALLGVGAVVMVLTT